MTFSDPDFKVTIIQRQITKNSTRYSHHSLNGSSDSVNGDLQFLWE